MRFRLDRFFRRGKNSMQLNLRNDNGTLHISWTDGDKIRTPSGKEEKCDSISFTVNGLSYSRIIDLTAKTVDKNRGLYHDIHGNTILSVSERYPIFDSYDAAYEDRYYHWYYILQPDRWSCVYYDDGNGKTVITEDVERILYNVSKALMDVYKTISKDGKLLFTPPA